MKMTRNLQELAKYHYDLIVIGGGIYGAWAAWDAALRGLSVALVEKSDFAGATSANSLKIIHGGLRYLQHGDIRRMRESIRERMILMKVAPHLVHPLPCLLPTYGHGLKGKEALSIALFLNDLVSFDRNSLNDPQKYIPKGRIISREETLQLLPGIDPKGLTGGAVWYDCQIYNSERLIFSLLAGAVARGARIANYAPVVDFLRDEKSIIGVRIRDVWSGRTHTIRGRVILNTAGPWLGEVIRLANPKASLPELQFCRAINLILQRQPMHSFAVGIPAKMQYRDRDSILNKGTRFLFMTPWRHYTLIGTEYLLHQGSADQAAITREELLAFLEEFNQAYPGIKFREEDIASYHLGLVPMDPGAEDPSQINLTKHYRIIDHEHTDGLQGLVSVLSVKYTTARHVTGRAVDLVSRKLKRRTRCHTEDTPIPGGQIERFGEYVQEEIAKRPWGLEASEVRHLIYNYGQNYTEILHYIEEDVKWRERVTPDQEVLWAEVVHAVREEMAYTLLDVVRRRTELGSAGCPGRQTLEAIARVMGKELGWGEEQRKQEVEKTLRFYHLSTKHQTSGHPVPSNH